MSSRVRVLRVRHIKRMAGCVAIGRIVRTAAGGRRRFRGSVTNTRMGSGILRAAIVRLERGRRIEIAAVVGLNEGRGAQSLHVVGRAAAATDLLLHCTLLYVVRELGRRHPAKPNLFIHLF